MTPRAARVVEVEAASPTFSASANAVLARANDLIELSGTNRAKGGYGTIIAVAKIGGRPPPGALLLKVFHDDAPASHARIVDNVSGLLQALERRGGDNWPHAVLGLPFCLVRVELDGEPALAAIMCDLHAIGYDASPCTTLSGARDYYRQCAAGDKEALAACFADRKLLLESIGFVHGDIHHDNVMVNMRTLDVQFIDYDGGVVVERGDERPLTANHADEFRPPEIGADPALNTAFAERWSTGTMMSYLLLGVSPSFFLKNLSVDIVERYARERPGWPGIDVNGRLFTEDQRARDFYPWLLASAAKLSPDVLELFKQLFAAGTTGELRPTAGDWVLGLRRARRPPSIEYVSVDHPFVIEAGIVTLSWVAGGATHVEVDGLGSHPASGQLPVLVDHTQFFTIRACNRFGEQTVTSPVVRVTGTPRINEIQMPTLSELGLTGCFDALRVNAPRSADRIPMPVLPRPAPMTAEVPPAGSRQQGLPLPGLLGLEVPRLPSLPHPLELLARRRLRRCRPRRPGSL